MKKHRGRIAVLAMIVLLLGAYLIYTRPLPLTYFASEEYRPEAITQIQCWFISPRAYVETLEYCIDDPAAVAELVTLTESIRIRRTLWAPSTRTLSPQAKIYHLQFAHSEDGPWSLKYELHRSSAELSYIAIGWTRYRISRKNFDALAACLEANLPADYLEQQQHSQRLIDSWNQEHRFTGGYNLQDAWSRGYVAGMAAAEGSESA